MLSRPRPTALLLAALLLLTGLSAGAQGAENERDLEPIPRIVVFAGSEARLGAETQRAIDSALQGAFASLGDVVRARDLLVRRFGVITASALAAMLQKNSAHPHTENAALTVGALRDTEGPALELKQALRPLVRIVTTSAAPHERAFAAIALGSFHWPESELPALYKKRADRYAAVPGPGKWAWRAAESLRDARRALIDLRNDKRSFARVAAMLALAKSGGPQTRKAYVENALEKFANANPHRADLLARAFLVAGDFDPYLKALRHVETPRRASAALAVAVALLQEDRAPWTTESARVLKPLKSVAIKPHLADGAEAVFARGVCALQNQANDEWKAIWDIATRTDTEEHVAEAAAQILRHCDLPWLRAELVRWAVEPQAPLKDPVLALVLLRAGEQGTPEAVDALARWLRNRAKRPVPTARWDPRWYIAVGLLRALHEGRIRTQGERTRVVEALRKAATQVLDKKAPFRDALAAVMEAHGKRIAAAAETSLYRLPRPALRQVERAFTCPHGLMARDVIDACVARVNATVQDIFGLNGIKPWKPGEPQTGQMPERFLKRYLDHYPYFSRLEFRTRRGARPYPTLSADGEGIDR